MISESIKTLLGDELTAQVETALEILKAQGVDAYVIGEIIPAEGEDKVIL